MLVFVAQPYITVTTMVLMRASMSLWSMIWSALLLAERYVAMEVMGVAIAIAGSLVPLLAASSHLEYDQEAPSGNGLYQLLMLGSCVLYALASTCKELVFRRWETHQHQEGCCYLEDHNARSIVTPVPNVSQTSTPTVNAVVNEGNTCASECLQAALLQLPSQSSSTCAVDVTRQPGAHAIQGGSEHVTSMARPLIDVFCITSAASVWQIPWALPTCALIGTLKKPAGMDFATFVSNFFLCFANSLTPQHGEHQSTCTWAWQAYAIYITINIAYNVCIICEPCPALDAVSGGRAIPDPPSPPTRLASHTDQAYCGAGVMISWQMHDLTMNECPCARGTGIYGKYSSLTFFVALKAGSFMLALISQLPWPLIGREKITMLQFLASGIVIVGFGLFRHGSITRHQRFSESALRRHACCWPLLGSVRA